MKEFNFSSWFLRCIVLEVSFKKQQLKKKLILPLFLKLSFKGNFTKYQKFCCLWKNFLLQNLKKISIALTHKRFHKIDTNFFFGGGSFIQFYNQTKLSCSCCPARFSYLLFCFTIKWFFFFVSLNMRKL